MVTAIVTNSLAEVATDLATQLSGARWLSEGSAGTARRRSPNRSGLGGTARDASGREQRFTKPLLGGADAAWSCERKARATLGVLIAMVTPCLGNISASPGSAAPRS